MYLTPQLKEYYQKDFTENVLPCTDVNWKLHPKLIDLLVQINKNDNIQTIYSKKSEVKYEPSYLYVSANKVGEKQLFELGVKLTEQIKDTCFMVMSPNDKKYGDSEIVMGCNTNDQYFNVKVFAFQIYTKKLKNHKLFWKFLYDNLIV
jgi:hypothetical protein